jgi:16S rRNA U1498 N3-methylase RsmE
VERLQAQGGTPIMLGKNRLRAETAGLALVVAALAVGGELGPPGSASR